jgi:hypothetical protein
MTMFKHIGSVSHGTMRPEDLIPTFIDVLTDLNDERSLLSTGATFEETERVKRHYTRITDQLSSIESRMYDDDGEAREDYFASEDASYDLEDLFNLLDSFAPDYFYFGAHPGDGSDYGFWLSEDFRERMEDDGVAIVSDLGELSEDYAGAVCLISDHGNATYGTVDGGRFNELWAVV